MPTYNIEIGYTTSRLEVKAKNKAEAEKEAWERFNEGRDCYPDEFEPRVTKVEVLN